jgi:AcrR family transcriptional regulator
MTVSFGDADTVMLPLTGASARTRDLMVRTAVGLMQRGQSPSVSDAAEAAGVSRATAYRYFPTQSALVDAVVDHALGPILRWDSASPDPVERVQDLLASSNDRIVEFEATFKAALGLSLQQWAQMKSGNPVSGPQFQRGHRIELLEKALEPLRDTLTDAQFGKLAKALSLIFGVEVILVLKDIWKTDIDDMQDVATWCARVLVQAAVAEAKAMGNQKDQNG